ncbi:hypothetical protein GCM10023116_00660 [Kistimonas scapharcae]|uniref:Uncharacterized protein n=2 Tax=Kistimonas scapharcae TaxID=1036133 RepID=A0ABP8UXH2_9GAMM
MLSKSSVYMSEDIVFKFQLGLILPKLRDNVGEALSKIVSELVDSVNAGRVGDDPPIGMDEVKQLIMQDIEIFLDNEILPSIEQKSANTDGESDTAPADEEGTTNEEGES